MDSQRLELYTSVSGESYSGMLLNLCESLQNSSMGKTKLVVSVDNTVNGLFIEWLESIFPFIVVKRSKLLAYSSTDQNIHSLIAQKIKNWNLHLKESASEYICFLDADMLVTQDFGSEIKRLIDEQDFYLGLTVKRTGVPINTGFVVAKREEKAISLFADWETKTLLSLKKGEDTNEFREYGAHDQVAIAKVIGWPLLKAKLDIQKISNIDGLLILPCNVWNNCSSGDSSSSLVIHYKHGVREIARKKFPYTRARPHTTEVHKIKYWDYVKRRSFRRFTEKLHEHNHTVTFDLVPVIFASLLAPIHLKGANSSFAIIAIIKLLYLLKMIDACAILKDDTTLVTVSPCDYEFAQSLLSFRDWKTRISRLIQFGYFPIRKTSHTQTGYE